MILAGLLAQGAALAAEPLQTFPASDHSVQSLKRNAIELHRDLDVFERELLNPATNQVAVFVSLDAAAGVRLEQIELKLDNAVVADHRYTDGERRALLGGGAQRLYVGNVGAGKHRLVAVFAGKGPGDRYLRRGKAITFEKGAEPRQFELRIRDSGGKEPPAFYIKEW